VRSRRQAARHSAPQRISCLPNVCAVFPCLVCRDATTTNIPFRAHAAAHEFHVYHQVGAVPAPPVEEEDEEGARGGAAEDSDAELSD